MFKFVTDLEENVKKMHWFLHFCFNACSLLTDHLLTYCFNFWLVL